MAKSLMSSESSLVAALQALWEIPPPGPRNLWNSREFIAVKDLLIKHYHNGKYIFGLEASIGNALRSLGLPCSTPHLPTKPRQELSEVAASLIHEFQRSTIRRRYICPLDMADDLPAFHFGNAKMAKFTAAELEVLFDATRLWRCFPDARLDAQGLSQFHWLVIEEDISVLGESGNRQFSWLDLRLDEDSGEIVPHGGRFPAAVERALFVLLMAPWEEWSVMAEVDWRGFRVPWIYILDDDLCAFPTPPPAPERLSWEPHFYQVDHDELVESERPSWLRISATAGDVRQALDSCWARLQEPNTLESDLFSTPVEHFLVRAFLSDGIDEVMAHLIVVEAAFGTEADHKSKLRLASDRHNESATRRVAARLSVAIGKSGAAKEYLDLYDMRCTYVHGRHESRIISTKQRVLARRLAREAANALVDLTRTSQPRECILLDLLNRGIANLPPKL